MAPKKKRTQNSRKRNATKENSTHSAKATKVDGSYHKKFTNFKESFPSREVIITKSPTKPKSSDKGFQMPIKSLSSEALRKKGNEIYSQVSNGYFGPCLLRHKLGKAHELYEAALDSASLNEASEKASCYKNLGAVNLLWGKAEWKIYVEEEEEGAEALKAIWAAKHHISKSLEFSLLPIQFGEHHGSKPDALLKQAEDSITQILEWVREQISEHNMWFEPILVELCALLENVQSNSCQRKKNLGTSLYKMHVELIFKQGIKYICREEDGGIESERTGYEQCLNAMRDCYLPLSKAEAIVYTTKDEGFIKEIDNMKEQVLLYQHNCESVQARFQGDDLLQKALFDDEVVSMELVWDAIDWYRQSILLSREKDLENEAMALSRIGKVYSSVLKNEQGAHRYHFECTRIALAIMCPRVADSEWYKYSSLKVREHQKEIVDKEKREHDEKHELDAQRLHETINVIKEEGEKSAEAFLQFIYTVHIHPDPKKGLLGSIASTENVKAALKKAIVSYHPDNNLQHAMDWQVLCEEITKILNCKYESYK